MTMNDVYNHLMISLIKENLGISIGNHLAASSTLAEEQFTPSEAVLRRKSGLTGAIVRAIFATGRER